MAIRTNQDTVKILCKSVLTRLENQKLIEFAPRLRQDLQEQLFVIVSPAVVTEHELHERTLQKLGMHADSLQDSEFTDSDQYRAARNMVKEKLGDDVLRGFYYQKPMKLIADQLVVFLMKSKQIDEVYADDADLVRVIVETMQKFDPSQLH